MELHHVQHPDLETTRGMTVSGAQPPDKAQQVGESVVNQGPGFYRDALIPVIFLITFSLYLVSMPKTVALEDDSIFILSGYFNGVSHPPGYPLYTVILNLFTKIPFADIAVRAHASSAFFGALSCCCLYWIFCLIGLDRAIAALATLVFSVTDTFWSQSIITEVYSLNLFLNLCLLLFSLRIFHQSDPASKRKNITPGAFYLFSITLGLALSNHWPLTVLALPAYLLLIARPYFALKNKVIVLLPAVGIVMASYLYLYFNNQSSPFINFSGKFNGLEELLEFVMRTHYAAVDSEVTAGWEDKRRFARDVLLQFGRELNLLAIFSLFGLFRLLRSSGARRLGLALLWLALANSLLLVLLINFDYSYLFSLVFKVYVIVSISMMFVLAGFGMQYVVNNSATNLTNHHLFVVLLVALGLNAYFSLPQNYRHQYSWGEEFSHRVLADLPENSILFSDGDVELGLLSYYHFIEKQRPDIRLYSSSGLLLDNRLFDYRRENKKNYIENYIDGNRQWPAYVAKNYYGVNTISGTIFIGRIGESEGRTQHSVSSNDIDLILRWSSADYTHDPWTRIAIEKLRHKAIAYITPAMKNPTDANLRNFISESIARLVQSQTDHLHFLVSLLKNSTEIDTQFYRSELVTIKRENLRSKQDDSHYVYVWLRSGQSLQSVEHLISARSEACRNWPSRKNTYCSVETEDQL